MNSKNIIENVDQKLKLSSLGEFIQETFICTENVKRLLQFECNEAIFALRPWYTQCIVKKVNEDICTCNQVTTENQAEEIAAGVSKALLQVQQLREKLSYNMKNQRKHLKEPSVYQIYKSKSTSNTKTTIKKTSGLHKNKDQNRKQNINENVDFVKHLKTDDIVEISNIDTLKTKSSFKVGHVRDNKILCNPSSKCTTSPKVPEKNISQKTKVNDKVMKHATTSNENKQVPATKLKNVQILTKLKKEKNFVLLNKLNIKNIRVDCKDVKDRLNMKSETFIEKAYFSQDKKMSKLSYKESITCAASTSELHNLIKNISLNSFHTFSQNKNNCPIHSNTIKKYTEEEIVTSMDIIEALDRFNVPDEISRTLKIYHTYLKTQSSVETINTNKRAINQFLVEFDGINQNIRGFKTENNIIIDIGLENFSLFKDTLNGGVNVNNLHLIKKKLSDLKCICKRHHIPNFTTTRFERLDVQNTSSLKLDEDKGWMSFFNGIWNNFSIINIEGLLETRCIRYSSHSELLHLFDIIQQLQQTQYLKNLINIVQQIVAETKYFTNVSSDECAQMYKMIFTLCQGSNPILVKMIK